MPVVPTSSDHLPDVVPPFADHTVVFDATHGQPNWSQTGYPSREMHTNFAGLGQRLCRLGCSCVALNERPLAKALAQARLLVIPPPTGWYNARKECWVPHAPSLFTPEEIQALLSFVRDGGRLLAFAYRFGDSFTGTNLRDLFGPLGCLLHDDAVIDITALRATPSLQTHFDTSADLLPIPWFRRGVNQLRWRASATFTLVPGATAQPLVLSPGGRCISFDRTQRRISFVSRPVAVAGTLAKGRFVLCGGPHLFETGTYGLLNEADNRQFIDHILRWLLKKDVFPLEASPETPAPARPWLVPGLVGDSEAFTFVEGHGSGEETVASVERVLRKTGLLKALNHAQWMP